ncbi:hypothetical protein EJ110_NYTH29253 [Nymphaea thermarum]|nr:hypothetical protein EJ110_NYTH29253 [Nymphaea thermarum]
MEDYKEFDVFIASPQPQTDLNEMINIGDADEGVSNKDEAIQNSIIETTVRRSQRDTYPPRDLKFLTLLLILNMDCHGSHGPPAKFSPEALPLFFEGIHLILSRWTKLRLAVENEWGGWSSCQKLNEITLWIQLHMQKRTSRAKCGPAHGSPRKLSVKWSFSPVLPMPEMDRAP